MSLAMGNAALYTRLLIKFRDSQSNFAGLFAAALRDADPMAATRCAHTLRGTAGNIGAKDVQAAAAALEQACKESASAEAVRPLLDETLAALSVVIDGLAKVGAGDTATGPTGAIADMTRVQPLLDQLAAQLADIDTEAAETMQELLALTQGTALANGLRKIASAVAEYEFEAAEAALRAFNETK